MFISFISPFYNVNNYLRDLMKSFEGMDFDLYELILIDDKGSDNHKAYKIFKEFDGVVNYRVLKNKNNIGLGFSRNVGLDNLTDKTTNVIYIDSDDLLSSNLFMNDISEDKITVFNSVIFNKKNERKIIRSRYKPGKQFAPIWGISIPVKIALENKFKTGSFEDGFVGSMIYKKYKNIVRFSDTIMIRYRQRKSSIMNSKMSEKGLDDFIKAHKIMVENNLISNKYMKSFFKGCYCYLLKNNIKEELSFFPIKKWLKRKVIINCKIRYIIKNIFFKSKKENPNYFD